MADTRGHAQPEGMPELLRLYRHERDLTQDQLAERAGLSARSIQDLERGLALPRRGTVARLVRALQLEGEPRLIFETSARSVPRRTAVTAGERKHSAIQTNLPRQLTSFVGREQALSELLDQLGVARLLTLVGAGGVGKTRLGLEVAAAAVERFRDGAWLVELAPIADPAHIAQTLMDALQIKEQQGRSVDEVLMAALQQRELLLILDNCEHLVGACAELAERLLRGCDRLSIIATSREALGVSGEVRWLVPSLGVPALGREGVATSPADASERVAAAEAALLFVERASAARSTFRVTEQEAEAVAQVCRAVDGIPLAIELAAAWVSVLPVEEIAARLAHSSDL